MWKSTKTFGRYFCRRTHSGRPSRNRLLDTGLSSSFIEALICKYLATCGTTSGRGSAEALGLPYRLLATLVDSLRTRQLVVHVGAAPFNDYYFTLSEQGRYHARSYLEECAYVGPAPVPLSKYVISVDAQFDHWRGARSGKNLFRHFKESRSSPNYFASLGPAINSGAGMFLFGCTGQRQIDHRPQIDRLFWANDLDSARGDRRRSTDYVV